MTSKVYNKTPKNDIYQEATNQVLELMEQHGTDWVKEWSGSALTLPVNHTTGKHYNGFNVIHLSIETQSKGYPVNIWAGYKQFQSKGLNVLKGQKGTHILRMVSITKEDDNGKEYSFPVLKTLTVFNIAQTDIDEETLKDLIPVKQDINQDERIASVDAFINKTGAIIHHGGNKAYYSPSSDNIQMPLFEQFTSSESYYSTLLHEVTHWTGNKKRLDRNLDSGFGSNGYAKEELIAELGSVFLCMQLGITPQPTPNHAKYLNGWLKALKNDKKFIIQASSKAEKAVNYLNECSEISYKKVA